MPPALRTFYRPPAAALRNHGAGAGLPLSSGQRRLWFLDRIEPGVRPAYHLCGAVALHGRLDQAALRRALNDMVARHDVLRTSFDEVDGEPVQRVAASAGFALTKVDLRGLAPQALEQALHRHTVEEVEAPFDLRSGPLFRGRLLQLGDEHHRLVVAMHHIVSDGWSIAVLQHEFAALYAAEVLGRPSALPALAIQYRDHEQWEQHRAALPTRQVKLDYWQRHLRGAPELLALPTDRPRPPVQSHAAAIEQCRIHIHSARSDWQHVAQSGT